MLSLYLSFLLLSVVATPSLALFVLYAVDSNGYDSNQLSIKKNVGELILKALVGVNNGKKGTRVPGTVKITLTYPL